MSLIENENSTNNRLSLKVIHQLMLYNYREIFKAAFQGLAKSYARGFYFRDLQGFVVSENLPYETML